MAIIEILIITLIVGYFVRKSKKKRVGTYDQNIAYARRTPEIDRPTPGVNRCPADTLINSPYYAEYKTTFGLIWYNGKQPQYKIDWLLYSLNLGRRLENHGTYVVDSMKKDLPYFCETEYEYDLFFNSEKPVMLGSIDGVMDFGLRYGKHNSNYSHPAKLEYWRQQLRDAALSGNLEAQGALCVRNFLFSEEEIAAFRDEYEADLRRLAAAGNAYAQLAVGKYLSPYMSQESFDWLFKAANQGLSDAWYRISEYYSSQYCGIYPDKEKVEPSEDEKAHFLKKSTESIYKGAVADNGVMAAWCQERVAGYYEDGAYNFPKDIEKARYWHQKASESREKQRIWQRG